MWAYTYDDAGNRLTKSKTGDATVSYTYNEIGQILSDGTTTYQYDAYGNLEYEIRASDGDYLRQYVWDGENHLLAVKLWTAGVASTATAPDRTVAMSYDDQGGRVGRKQTAGATVEADNRYLTDYGNPTGYSQVLEQLDRSATSAEKDFIYGADLLAQADSGGGPAYLLGDHLGSTRLLTDASGGAITNTAFDYSPYGEPLGTSGSSLTDHPHAFTGQWRDETIGMQFHRARWFLDLVGSWISSDPIFDWPDNFANPFSYASSNPTSKSDVLGLFSLVEVAATAAIQGTLAVLNVAVAGAVIGGVMGGFDAWLDDKDVWQGFMRGYFFGFLIAGLLAALPEAAVILVPWFVKQAAIAAGEASGEGNVALARYRMATLVLMVVGAGIGGGSAVGRNSLFRSPAEGLVEAAGRQNPGLHPLLELQRRAYLSLEKNRSRIENVPESPVRTRYASRSGTYKKSGSAKHNNMIEETIDVLISEGILDPSQGPIYKGGRQISLNAAGDEIYTQPWSFDNKAYRMPDIIGRSPKGDIININVSFRNSEGYELGALNAITNADDKAAFALFFFGD